MKQGRDVIPIPGTKRIRFLEENWGALEVRLSDDEEGEIRELVAGRVAGARGIEEALAMCFANTREE